MAVWEITRNMNQQNKISNDYLYGDLTIRDLTDEMKLIKSEVEKLLFKYGFSLAKVKPAYGQDEIICYNLGDLYCRIDFMKNYTGSGEFKDWVLIEYADSLNDAAINLFEDGCGVPLDIPLGQIIEYLEKEVMQEISSFQTP